MKHHNLAHSSVQVSSIGLGGMSLDAKSIEENQIIVSKAIEAGITYFDTADLYDKGANELLLGNILKSKRKDVVLATKVGNKWRADGSGWDWKASKRYIIETIEESLGRLQTDYIDLYQLHGGTIEDPIDEFIEAFEILKKQGKIRAYGISSIRPNVIKSFIEKSNISTIMMQYSLLDRRPMEYFEFINKYQVAIVSRGSLAQGLMINKPAKEYLTYSIAEVSEIQKIIKDFAEQQGVAAQTVGVAYALAQQPVAANVIGIRTVEQMNNLAKSIGELAKVNIHDLNVIANNLKSVFYTDHR